MYSCILEWRVSAPSYNIILFIIKIFLSTASGFLDITQRQTGSEEEESDVGLMFIILC